MLAHFILSLLLGSIFGYLMWNSYESYFEGSTHHPERRNGMALFVGFLFRYGIFLAGFLLLKQYGLFYAPVSFAGILAGIIFIVFLASRGW